MSNYQKAEMYLSQQKEAYMNMLNQFTIPTLEKILDEIDRDVHEVEKALQSFEYLKSRDCLDESFEENVLGFEPMTHKQFTKYREYLRKSIMEQILEKYPNVQFNTTLMTIEFRIDTPNNDSVLGSIFLTKKSIDVHLWIAYDNGGNGGDITKYFNDKNIKTMKDEILKDIESLINEV